MKLITNIIQPYLESIQQRTDSKFTIIYDKLESKLKYRYKPLLIYLDFIINNNFNGELGNNNLKNIHIHIEPEFDLEIKALLANFIITKLHFKHIYNDSISKTGNDDYLKNKILGLTNKINEFSLPAKRSKVFVFGKSTAEINEIKRNHLKDKGLLLFYKSIFEVDGDLKFRLIFNCNINLLNSISDYLEKTFYAVKIEENILSSNLINIEKSLNDLDDKYSHLIDEITEIINFDCERKKTMNNFSLEEINKWNLEFGANFKQYLIITFGKENNTISNIINKIDKIRNRFKIPINSTYTILSSEINLILNNKNKIPITVKFVGLETSTFWDHFLLEINIRELYELRSIKLMNIYSICLTEEIKNYVLIELFSKNLTSELITTNTIMAIQELRDEDVEILRNALSNALDIIIHSEIKPKIIEHLNNSHSIVLDEAIIKNTNLINMFMNSFGIRRSMKLLPWSELKNDCSNSFLILSYRDQGKFPHFYYPNLLEFEYRYGTSGEAILHNFLFGNHCNWSKYKILNEYHKYLSHPIRDSYFEWDKLKKLIQSNKPKTKLTIDWNLENEYSSSENRETYKVKLQNQRAKIYHSSDLLIFSEINIGKPRIERVKWFFENIDFDETKYEIQKLDELLDEFNPAERLIDTSQQELELEIIRKQLGLGNETAGRIWKTLLRKKSDILGVESLYEELRLQFDKNNIPLVSINHFRNSWINIESDTLMPRGNKAFKFLCDYLMLNNNYRLIIYRLKNASISGKIEATKKYSNILKNLFSDGCFDVNVSIQTLLKSRVQYYRDNHALDELGIDSENPLNGLITLINIIQPELKLKELEKFEKISNE